MKLQVQEHFKTFILHLTNQVRAGVGEQLFAYFYPATGRIELVDHGNGFICIVVIQCNNNTLVMLQPYDSFADSLSSALLTFPRRIFANSFSSFRIRFFSL